MAEFFIWVTIIGGIIDILLGIVIIKACRDNGLTLKELYIVVKKNYINIVRLIFQVLRL